MATKQKPKIERRSPRSHQAILRAAVELCREQGYGAVTVEGIAARAGVGKQTIYRWWPSKGAVVLDAWMDTIAAQVSFPELGDSMAEIRQWLHSLAALLASPETGRSLAELIGAQQSDPALAQLFNERVFIPIRPVLRGRIEQAQQAGQMRRLDPDVVVDVLIGPIWYRLLLAGDPASPERVDAMLETTLAGLRRPVREKDAQVDRVRQDPSGRPEDAERVRAEPAHDHHVGEQEQRLGDQGAEGGRYGSAAPPTSTR